MIRVREGELFFSKRENKTTGMREE
jgi:hypothetical protein